MKLIWLNEVDSTSSEAQRQIQGGEAVPFAVAAGLQSAGRGRRGRNWEGTTGNLYLTLALPSPIKDWDPGLFSLRAALCVHAWLQKTFGVFAHVKWPNDLLWQGRKLGGILCEMSTMGQERGPLVVGIGLNLQPGNFEGAASISETFQGDLVPQKLAADLANHFSELWFQLDDQGCSDGYQGAVSPAFRWNSKEGEEWWESKLLEGGKLQLLRTAHRSQVLDSSWHDWHYAPMAQPVCVDVGNTATKFYVLEKGSWQLHDGLPDGVAGPVPTISVNSARLGESQQSGKRAQLRPVTKRGVRSWGSYPLEQVGVDRLALIEGYLSLHEKPALLVSAGTATTVDVVGDRGQHLGGWIIPGLQTSLSALHGATAQLPLLQMTSITQSKEPFTPALTTAEGIAWGCLDLQVGWLRQLQVQFPDFQVFVCGGFGRDLAAKLPGSRYSDSFVPQGIWELAGGFHVDR